MKLRVPDSSLARFDFVAWGQASNGNELVLLSLRGASQSAEQSPLAVLMPVEEARRLYLALGHLLMDRDTLSS
jgi:hypothetical protein